MPTLELPEHEIAEVCRRFHVKELSVFGSAVRGTLGPDSDIDMLVEFQPEARIGILAHTAAEREFSRILGRRVDLVSKRALKPLIRREVLLEARQVYAA